MNATGAVRAASDLHGVGRLQMPGLGSSTDPHFTQVQSNCQDVERLRERADAAKKAGDYPLFCQLRRAFLLAQAAAYASDRAVGP